MTIWHRIFGLPEREVDRINREQRQRIRKLETDNVTLLRDRVEPDRAQAIEDLTQAIKDRDAAIRDKQNAIAERDAYARQIAAWKSIPISFDGCDIVDGNGRYGRILRFGGGTEPYATYLSVWSGDMLCKWMVETKMKFAVLSDGIETEWELSIPEVLEAIRRAQQKSSWLNLNHM